MDSLGKLKKKKIIFYCPPPISHSGGHRTFYRHINYLAGLGCDIEVCFVGKKYEIKSESEIRQSIFNWFGLLRARVSIFIPHTQIPDMVIATSWPTAFHVARWDCPKVYFIQDMENIFNPANHLYAQALSSYEIGLDSITIGKWLRSEIERFGSRAIETPFGVDFTKYYTDSRTTRNPKSVLILDQPDKARRCHDLLQQTVNILKEKNTSIEILSYGTHQSYLKGVNHHFGLLGESELGQLYRESRVGIALSASNPSRIPFEMAACGLPFIDLDLPNTRLDYLNLAHTKSRPFPGNLANVILEYLKTPLPPENNTLEEILSSIKTELETFALNLIWFLENPKDKSGAVFELPDMFDSGNSHFLGVVKKHMPIRIKNMIKKLIN